MVAQLSLFEQSIQAPPPDRIGQAAVRPRFNSQLLTPGKGRTGDYDFTLNPYVGCSFGCSYCYAAFFVADESKRARWGEWVEPKIDAVARLLRNRELQGKRIYMSSVTDPYQPLEAKLQLTRRILEVLSEPGNQARVVIQTRSPLVTRDIDILSRFEHVRVNMSVTTDSDEVRKRFEPNCASIESRLQALEILRDAGIKTSVCICPMLPVENPEAFAIRLSGLRAAHYVAGRFHIATVPFSSGTREEGLKIAREMGWSMPKYLQTFERMKTFLPPLTEGKQGFAPV